MYDDEEFTSKIEVQEKEPPPLRSKVDRALGHMIPNKAPGPDEVPSEFFLKREGMWYWTNCTS